MSKRKITVIPGDGIGPSIIESAIQILTHAGCDFDYDYADAGLVALEKHGELLPPHTLETIAKHRIALKGASLRKAHLLPGELVTFATGADVQVTGPRVREFRGEEALLAKFLAVSDPRRTVVCATQGHGEPALDSLEPYSGHAHLRDLLRDAGLEVRVADLGETFPVGRYELRLESVAPARGPNYDADRATVIHKYRFDRRFCLDCVADFAS